jgi:uncharacterized protein YegL
MAKKIVKKTTVTTTTVTSGTNKTLLVCILDRSGSMNCIIDDAIGGFNRYLKDQKKEDEDATMTVALFDDRYELLYNNVDLHKVKKMTRDDWSPRGLTALYDAIGKTINDVESELKKVKKSQRPDKIMVAIVTDGGENASKEFNHDDIKKLIKKKERDDWQFTFLAADQDAFSVGSSMGMSGGNTFSYTNTTTGNATMFDALSKGTKLFRSVAKTDANYSVVSASLMVDEDDNSGTSTDVTFTTTTNTTDGDEEDNS